MHTQEIVELYTEATCWHGTGRYKYNERGEVVDVLKGMITEGGLLPHDDDWDWELGKIQSVSLARSRMYARLYAGMNMPHGKRIGNEYRPRLLWFYYFFNTSRLLALFEHGSPYGLFRNYPRKLADWARKITMRRIKTMRDIFLKGTDIVENYPILIGIKSTNIRPVVGARVFNLHEVRTASSIGFTDMTHIEVPHTKIAETTALLHENGIQTTVIPIEDGELYCRQFSFFSLVGGRPLTTKNNKHFE